MKPTKKTAERLENFATMPPEIRQRNDEINAALDAEREASPTPIGPDMTDLDTLQRQLARAALTDFDTWQGGALVMLIRELRLLRAGVWP